jgi:hypothetical protein
MRYTFIFLSFICFNIFGQTKNVLFLGNSYTASNSLPQLTANIALSLNDTLNWDSNTPGGYTFQQHSTNSTSLSKIATGTWDYVVLQEQSQIPSFPPTQVANDCYPYAATLVDSIKSANPCAEPLFFMTWGRENGDQSNCVNYPPLCTYDGMQARLRESYIQMSLDNQCAVSPVGAAWKYVRDQHPSIGLYSNDGSHPSIYGSYLAACVHYSSIFKKSPVGSTYISSISNSDALLLQEAAAIIVLDSLDNWRIGANDVDALFSYQVTGSTSSFSYTGINGTSLLWDFGDGNTSTTFNPIHNYVNNGNYSVQLIANNNCGSDTLIQNVGISSVGIQEISAFKITQQKNMISLFFDSSAEKIISIVNLDGKILYLNNTNATELTIPVLGGKVYILSVTSSKEVKTTKIFVP